MDEINLQELMQAKKAQSTALQEKTQEVSPAVDEASLEQFSPQEKQKIAEIKEHIDFLDTAALIQYGAPAQKNIADFSDSVLTCVRAKDSGYVGDLFSDLLVKVKGFDSTDKGSFLQKIPLFGSLVNKAEKMRSSYDKLSVQVDKIQGELEKAKLSLLKDIAMLDSLYDKNLSYFKELQLYIKAGEEKIAEMREKTLPKLHADAAAANDPMAAQVVSDFEKTLDRFEKQVHDLKVSKTIAIQSAPQIRLIQNNDKALVERLQSAIYNTIPLWKNQMVIAIGLAKQKKVLDLQHSVNDATNELLLRNSEMLRQGSIEVAKENERSIVDIETVQKVNENLIATIEETLQIQQEGHRRRTEAEGQLAQIEDRLKQVLLQGKK